MTKILIAATFLLFTATVTTAAGPASTDAPQSPINPAAPVKLQYPKIVLYSTSWCPHCRQAKEYMTSNNIPFINKDVELDDSAMNELINKYKSQGVPVIVLGNDEKVLKGFDEQRFKKAVEELQGKKK
ncbi:glutaredoxin domain-containing protein [Geobacter argillaceus]|uniref:Glutaredoxin-like YruB-family protein n=1 Tax=Geobacter argillaceus TaxID=345631 RepID=A0A562WRD5_9BACT|nr:glutaredoxin domain-containing protein [Geobacter argillaceus]TWJ32681.1 glutaredoxin-like YruB-family protein [Geobacter argillaceus]